MKKMILILIIVLIGLVSVVSAATDVYVEPASSIVGKGDKFVISISINTTDSIYAVSFDLNFPNAIIEGISSKDGGFLGKDGQTVLVAVNNINNAVGKYSFAATRAMVQTGVNGTGVIANITFNASDYGIGNLIISNIQITNPNLNPITVNKITNGTIKINSPPILDPIGDKEVDENQTLQFKINATDNDGDILTYSVDNLPLGASFSGQEFLWTPNFTQAGTYQVTFNVTSK